MVRRVILAAALALPIAVVAATPAGACGGLVGENGTIQLGKTTTLAAYTAVSSAISRPSSSPARASRWGRWCRCPTCPPR